MLSKPAWPTWQVPDQLWSTERDLVSKNSIKKVGSPLFSTNGTNLSHFSQPGSVSISSARTRSVTEGGGPHPNPI